jgi:methylamine utilization protein MauE
LVLAGILVASAGSKLAGARSSQAALATFGIEDVRLRRLAWGGLVAVELVLGAGVAADFSAAAYAAAGLMVVFAGALGVALARGRAGSPCACFG